LVRLPKDVDKKNTVTKKPGDASEDDSEAKHYYEISWKKNVALFFPKRFFINLNDFGTDCFVLFNSCGEVYGRNRLAIDLLAKYKRQNKEKALKDKKLEKLKRSHTRCHPLRVVNICCRSNFFQG
jgi:hypothetical protein